MMLSRKVWRVSRIAADYHQLMSTAATGQQRPNSYSIFRRSPIARAEILTILSNWSLHNAYTSNMPFANSLYSRYVAIDVSKEIHPNEDKSLRTLRRRSSSHDCIRSKYPALKSCHQLNNVLKKLSAKQEDKENQVIPIPSTFIPPSNGRSRERRVTIAVEGNIGSGKTTLLRYLAKRDDVEVNVEPVDDWKDCGGHNLLGLMYQDPVRWAFTFQSYVQLTMLNQHVRPQVKPVRLLERSIHSARYCFVENMGVNKRLADAEYTVLDKWFQWIMKNADVKLDQIVYLRSSPEVCHQRIKQRCRKEEQGIPLEYLQEIHDRYEEWLMRKTKFSIPAPVIVLDAERCLPDMFKMFEEQQHKILLKSAIN